MTTTDTLIREQTTNIADECQHLMCLHCYDAGLEKGHAACGKLINHGFNPNAPDQKCPECQVADAVGWTCSDCGNWIDP